MSEKNNMQAAHSDCAAAQSQCQALASVLDRVGNKWVVMVVGVLSGGPARFTDILRAIDGISHRMLTLTLRGLERDGLVTRHAFAEVPPRVEYRLTGMGRSLIEPLDALAEWASANQPKVEQAREAYDAREG